MLGNSVVARVTRPRVVVVTSFAFIIASPFNEWRGFMLQSGKKLTCKEFFKPVNYARSTLVHACIMVVGAVMWSLADLCMPRPLKTPPTGSMPKPSLAWD